MSTKTQNNSMKIKKLEIEYILQVKSILDIQFGFDYITLDSLTDKIKDENSLCLIALKDKEVLGVSIAAMGSAEIVSQSLLKEKDWFDENFKQYHLIGLRKQMAVKKTYQGKGIGTQLIQESTKQLSKSCQVLITIVWEKDQDQKMKKIMAKNQFKSILTISNYWKKDSIEKKYTCPACKIIPCTCSANIYVRENDSIK